MMLLQMSDLQKCATQVFWSVLWAHVFTRSIRKPPLTGSQLHAITSIIMDVMTATKTLTAAATGRRVGVIFGQFGLEPLYTKIGNFRYTAAFQL